MSLTRTAALAASALLTASTLVACAGGGEDAAYDGSADDALADARKQLDDTSGVHIEVESTGLPKGSSGLTAADGVAVHPASFEGTFTGTLSGLSQDGDVVAIEDDVWLKLPILGPEFENVDPGKYGAPNPADLIATDGGLSELLTETEDAEKSDEAVRGGENNEDELTEVTGTIPGDLVTVLVPNAGGDEFDVTYLITKDGELREMEITGEFYEGTDDTTYTLTFTDYGTDEEITAP